MVSSRQLAAGNGGRRRSAVARQPVECTAAAVKMPTCSWCQGEAVRTVIEMTGRPVRSSPCGCYGSDGEPTAAPGVRRRRGHGQE